MAGVDGCDIEESDDEVIFVNDCGWDFTLDDSSEDRAHSDDLIVKGLEFAAEGAAGMWGFV